jgi:hypothetical protein
VPGIAGEGHEPERLGNPQRVFKTRRQQRGN